MTEQELIDGCKKNDRKAQKALYDRFSPDMLGVCRRYVKVQEDAEDVLCEAFFKVFDKIDQFKQEGSFEGWIRRIVINESLLFLRKWHNFSLTVDIDQVDISEPASVPATLEAEEILNILNELPTGYRTVFNLYVLEGLKHKEIAETLGISINTSKSQLILAKKRMQELLTARNEWHKEQAG